MESFEMNCWRKMEKISCKDHVTNEEVLNRVGEKRTILSVIRKRKANWIGHTLRHEGLLKHLIEGKVEGKRGRGRKRMQVLDDLIERRSYQELKLNAENRSEWRRRFDIR